MPSLHEEPESAADVLIVGGGLVGACLAIALEALPVRVVMLESHAGNAMPPVFDQRNLSFNMATVNALNALGVLPLLRAPAGSIRAVDTSRVGDFGSVRMQAGDYGRHEFGKVVIASDFGHALEARLASVGNLERIRPATYLASHLDGDLRTVSYSTPAGESRMRTRLLVGADGAASTVRESLGIATARADYGHRLFVAAARASAPLDGVAYERLSDSGPIALLPRGDGQIGVVIGVANDDAERVAALPDAAYAAYINQRFGYRAGTFTSVGPRSQYPGSRVLAAQTVAARAVLIGNAAQSLHPVGAQGFNLGLRDALSLAEEIAAGSDPGSERTLSMYRDRRASDRERTIAMSHTMASVGSSPSMPSRMLRQAGMLAAGRIASVQSKLVAQAMGLSGDVPVLCKDPL